MADVIDAVKSLSPFPVVGVAVSEPLDRNAFIVEVEFEGSFRVRFELRGREMRELGTTEQFVKLVDEKLKAALDAWAET